MNRIVLNKGPGSTGPPQRAPGRVGTGPPFPRDPTPVSQALIPKAWGSDPRVLLDNHLIKLTFRK